MTAAPALLARLHDLGVAAWADGATLRLRPASIIPVDLMADLRAHKAGVLALLAANDDLAPEPPPPAPVAPAMRLPDRPDMVEALAAALAARPTHQITDPERATAYFAADARRRLAVADDPFARGLMLGFQRHRGVRP